MVQPEIPPTGFDGSRRSWQELADRLLAGAAPFASPSGALIALPGPSSASGRWSDGMEGFARTFLLAAFRVRGAAGDDPHGMLARYRSGLVAGVDPASEERWPTIAERRQAVVEAASIAIGLSETRPWLWDRLDDRAQQLVVDWLAGVVGTSGYTNNWIWFQNVIEAFLASVGGPWSPSDLDRNAEIQENLYVADGWYSDGAGPNGARQSFDYYAGWAWHVYPLLHARIRGVPLAPVHRERLALFVDQAKELIGSGGAPLFQGRSLTYRFGMLAPFWAGALSGATPLPAGATRALAGDVVSHFLEAGAVNDRGVLPIGWHGEFTRLRQLYTGGSSPYWASKAFLGLLLPDDHAEWTAPAPDVAHEDVTVRALPAPGWIVVSSRDDGIVRVVNHGSDGFRGPAGAARADDPFYLRSAYSNVTSPALSPTAIARPLDAHTALLDSAGAPSHRGAIERVHLGERVAVSRSRVHWLDIADDVSAGDSATWASLRRGPVVTTASVVHGVHELRLAWWTPADEERHSHAATAADAAWPEDHGPWRLRIGGWALPFDGASARTTGATATRTDGLTSAVLPVHALDVVDVAVQSGATPFAEHCATPWAAQTDAVAPGTFAAALVVLSGDPSDADRAHVPAVALDDDGLRVRWPDGTVDVVPTRGEVRA